MPNILQETSTPETTVPANTPASSAAASNVTSSEESTTEPETSEIVTIHEHSFTVNSTKEPTCTETGYTLFLCPCGESYTETIQPNGHTESKVEGKEPTCTEDGYTDSVICSKCNVILSPSEKLVAEHHPQAVAGKPSTCTSEGLSEGSKCTVCGIMLVEQIVLEKAPHTTVLDEGISATCTTSGKTEGSHCSVCGIILQAQETINKTAHTPVNVKGVAATCTVDGLTDGKKCGVCGTILEAQKAIKASHSIRTIKGKAATCTVDGLTDGKECSVCGKVMEAQKTIKAAHKPTTDKDGNEICSVCGAVLKAVVKVSKITLSVSSTSITVGEKMQISATVTPSNAQNKTVSYSITSGSSYGSVDSKGQFTAKAAGKVKIKVTANDGSQVSSTIEITVKAKAVLEGSGTKTDPYLVNNESDLKNLSKFASSKNLYFKQTADITLSSPWTPIANFKSTYDGQGHSITGLRNAVQDSYTFNEFGLFASCENASFKNLRLLGVKIDIHLSQVGALVGNALDSSFENIVVEGEVSSASWASCIGGICGRLYAETNKNSGFSNCQVTGIIEGAEYVGGITGEFTNAIEIDMDGETYVSHYAALNFSGCSFHGTVNGTEYVGGLIGSAKGINIVKCAANVTMTIERMIAGGIVGEYSVLSLGNNSSSHPSIISECAAKVQIDGTNTGYGSAFFGGLAGWVSSYYGIDISNCSATGSITTQSSWSSCQDRSTYDGGLFDRYRNPIGALVGYLCHARGELILTTNAANVALTWAKYQPCTQDYAYCSGSLIGWLKDVATRDLIQESYKASGRAFNQGTYLDITESMLTGSILGSLSDNYCVSTDRTYFEAHPRILVKNGSTLVSAYKSMPKYTYVTNLTDSQYTNKNSFSGFDFVSTWSMTSEGPIPTAVKNLLH